MGISLNFKKIGSGKPIIILHGLFGMLDNWNSIGNKLSDNYTIYLIDQRDHGRSAKNTEFGYELIASDLKNFCVEHELSKVNIVGHSMGGKSAMTFADRYPELIDKMMIIDIAPKKYLGGHEHIFEAILSVPIDQITNRKEVDTMLSEHINHIGVRQFLMKNLTRKKEGGFEWKANFRLLYESYAEISDQPEIGKQNEIDTLFIKGGKSDYILPEDESLIKQYYPNASIETIAEAGHWVHAERPIKLLSKINSFFQ